MRVRPRDICPKFPGEDRLEWSAPAYLNGFVNYVGGNWQDGGYALDEMGYVVMRGLISNPNVMGSFTTIFILPPDMRPGMTEMFAAFGSHQTAMGQRIDINPDGTVFWVATIGGYTIGYQSLCGIRFKPDRTRYP